MKSFYSEYQANALGDSASVRQCVLLAGGLGSRLGELSRVCPKPLLEVAGRPFIFYLLRQMVGFGFRRFLLLAGHLGDQVEACGRRLSGEEGLPEDMEIQTLVEPEPLGTAGALRAAGEYLDEHFLLSNGDSFFQCDLSPLTRPFQQPAAWGRLALTRAAGGRRFGTVLVEGSQVTGFREKVGMTGFEPAFMNMGLYFFSRNLLRAIPAGKCSLEIDIFPSLARQGRLEARIFEPGFFIDIGIPADLARAQTALPEALHHQEHGMPL